MVAVLDLPSREESSNKFIIPLTAQLAIDQSQVEKRLVVDKFSKQHSEIAVQGKHAVFRSAVCGRSSCAGKRVARPGGGV